MLGSPAHTLALGHCNDLVTYQRSVWAAKLILSTGIINHVYCLDHLEAYIIMNDPGML